MVVQIKDVMLKELAEEPLVTLDKSPIPSDAQRIENPAAKAKAKAAAPKGPAPKTPQVTAITAATDARPATIFQRKTASLAALPLTRG